MVWRCKDTKKSRAKQKNCSFFCRDEVSSPFFRQSHVSLKHSLPCFIVEKFNKMYESAWKLKFCAYNFSYKIVRQKNVTATKQNRTKNGLFEPFRATWSPSAAIKNVKKSPIFAHSTLFCAFFLRFLPFFSLPNERFFEKSQRQIFLRRWLFWVIDRQIFLF